MATSTNKEVETRNDITSVLDRLKSLGKKVKPTGTGKFICQCPAHEDNNPSLSIKKDGDRVLVFCHAGCKYTDIMTSLGFSPNRHFPYKDSTGKHTFTVHKPFKGKPWASKPDGTSGVEGIQRILYNLPELLGSNGEFVFIVGGEKDCDTLRALDLIATSCPFGEGPGKWKKEYSQALKDSRCVILPDNDDVGREHAKKVAESLLGIAKEVRVVELDNLPPKGDVTEWMQTGGDVDSLMLRVEEAKPLKKTKAYIKCRTLSEIKPEKAVYLWPEVIPSAALSLIVSQEGVGKSTPCTYICSVLTNGLPWPNKPYEDTDIGGVIWFSHEENPCTELVPRMMANNVDLNRVHLAEEVQEIDGEDVPFLIERDIGLLEDMLDTYPETKLIVIDPITGYSNCNENSNREVRQALKPLVDLSHRRKIAIVGLTHLSKKVDLGFINRITGSRQWGAVPRMSWGIQTVQEEDDEGHKVDTNDRDLLCIKSNQGRKPQGLRFSIGEAHGHNGAVTFSNERLTKHIDEGGAQGQHKEEIGDWLRHRITKNGGEMARNKIVQEAEKQFDIKENRLGVIASDAGISKVKGGYQGESLWKIT